VRGLHDAQPYAAAVAACVSVAAACSCGSRTCTVLLCMGNVGVLLMDGGCVMCVGSTLEPWHFQTFSRTVTVVGLLHDCLCCQCGVGLWASYNQCVFCGGVSFWVMMSPWTRTMYAVVHVWSRACDVVRMLLCADQCGVLVLQGILLVAAAVAGCLVQAACAPASCFLVCSLELAHICVCCVVDRPHTICDRCAVRPALACLLLSGPCRAFACTGSAGKCVSCSMVNMVAGLRLGC
jgi:hypothetical protein